MPIDWFTVVAQAINLLVLVVLLKRFLYGPILRAVAERETKIQRDLKEAEERDRQATERSVELAKERADLDAARDGLLTEARSNAEAEHQALMEATRKDVERTRAQWLESFERRRDAVLHRFAQNASADACEIARRALSDLADARLEDQVLVGFLRQLKAAEGKTTSAFAEAARAKGLVTVRTSFELPVERRGALEAALKMIVGDGVRFEYVAAQDGLVGIAVEAGGQRMAWSVDQYIGGIQSRLEKELDDVTGQLTTANRPTTAEDRNSGTGDSAAVQAAVTAGAKRAAGEAPAPATPGGKR